MDIVVADREVVPTETRVRAGTGPRWNRLASGAIFVTAFVVTVAWFSPLASLGIDPHHDGVMLKPALDVLSGQVIHRDTWTQYGPLTTWIQAAAMWGFGPRLLVIKYATVVFYGLSAGMMALIWRRFLPLLHVGIALALWLQLAYFSQRSIVMLPWSSVYALFFQLLAIAARLRALERRRPETTWNALAGVFVAAAALCRQPVGVVTFLALLLTVSLEGWHPHRSRFVAARAIFGGFAAVFAPLLLVAGVVGALRPYIEQNILWPYLWATGPTTLNVTAARTVHAAVPVVIFLVMAWLAKRSRWPVLTNGLLALLVLAVADLSFRRLPYQWSPEHLCFAIAVAVSAAGLPVLWASIHRLIRPRMGPPLASGGPPMTFLAALLLVGASFSQFYPISDIRHLFWSIGPAVGIFFVLIRRAVPQIATFVFLVLAASVTMFALRDRSYTLGLKRTAIAGVPVLRGLRVEPEFQSSKQPVFNALRAYLGRHPDAPSLNLGVDALYPALGQNLVNVDPYWVSWGPARRDQARRDRFIEQEHPIVWMSSSADIVPFCERHNYYVAASDSPAPGWRTYVLLPRRVADWSGGSITPAPVLGLGCDLPGREPTGR